MKKFEFYWREVKKYSPQIDRKSIIQAETAEDAMGAFIKVNGNLKKNEVFKIQEIDKKNQPIGEPITLMSPEATKKANLKAMYETLMEESKKKEDN